MHQFWGTRCSTNDADKVGMVTFVGSVLERTLVAVQPWPMRLLSVQRQFVSQDKCRTLGKQHLELYLASPESRPDPCNSFKFGMLNRRSSDMAD